jgi:glycosyltransferase involved in cell wall biosynthesis
MRDESTILRHIEYGQILDHVTNGGLSLIILTRGNPDISSVSRVYKEEKTKFVFNQHHESVWNFIVSSIRFTRKNKSKIDVLVSGDPWETYWFCRFLRLVSKTNARIQVQIHADIMDANWKKLSLANQIRFFCINLDSKLIKNIRLVSQNQMRSFLHRFPHLESKVFALPVPLSIMQYEFPRENIVRENLNIGFVGRVHKDRGLKSFLIVVNRLNQDGWRGQVHVVGEGPELDSFKQSLNNILGSSRVIFHGVKSGDQLRQTWTSIDVLLNTSSTESYGRSIREALYYGKKVLTFQSNGILDLEKERFSGRLSIIHLNDPETWIDKLKQDEKNLTDGNYPKQIWERNRENLFELARSWK